MGCCFSKSSRGKKRRPQQQHGVPLQQHAPAQGAPSHGHGPNQHASGVGMSTGPIPGGKKVMIPAVRQEFLRAVEAGLRDVPHVVIGGSALAEHGSKRGTSDLDVLVGGGYSKRSVEDLILGNSGGRILKRDGKLRYFDGNNDGYDLDLEIDNRDLSFDVHRDTELKNGARLGKIVFLLNTKAHGWKDRLPFEENYQQKRANDAADILFCVQSLRGKRNIDRSQLNWVYHRDFWTPFHQEYPYMASHFKSAGLWTDDTNFGSGSGSGRSSRSNSSNGSQPGRAARVSNGSHSGSQSGARGRGGSRNNSGSSNHSRRS